MGGERVSERKAVKWWRIWDAVVVAMLKITVNINSDHNFSRISTIQILPDSKTKIFTLSQNFNSFFLNKKI